MKKYFISYFVLSYDKARNNFFTLLCHKNWETEAMPILLPGEWVGWGDAGVYKSTRNERVDRVSC
jgi:hypothetical protein